MRTTQDRIGAALIVVLGVATVWVGAGYRLGSLNRMGAGYVPVVIGSLMIVVGLLIAITTRAKPAPTLQSTVTPPTAEHARVGSPWRGWLCIVGGVVAFVVLGRWGGLVPATFAAVFVSAMGDRENTVRSSALLAIAVTLLGVAIFGIGLKLPFPLFTWG